MNKQALKSIDSKKLKNIEKVASIIGGKIESFSDNSSSWIIIENKDHSVIISFDGKGNKFTDITMYKKIYGVVEEVELLRIEK